MQLDVFSDLSEQVDYNLANLKLRVAKGTLIQFDKLEAACHWHSDLEFISVLDGYMSFYVQGETVLLEKGQGIFVNSKRLHYGYSSDMSDCTYFVVCIHPSLIGNESWIGTEYWEEKFGDNTEDYMVLKEDCSWQNEVLTSIDRLYAEMHSQSRNPLLLLSLAVSLCAATGGHIKARNHKIKIDHAWSYIWMMTSFIHANYENKITLDDIASSGSVSRSRCCNLFGEHIGQAPNEYLTNYRLKKSCELLVGTGRSISEVALSCGFQSASYYSYVFRKEFGKTPNDYRKQHS
ncbi:AraC family transcriptional regulator [Paenibacillus glycanilyticus]|uniref:AraC family transcriptional regulator n=1 Tax=Paenibacillus glycanilyticus TaxID=126569 RepID=UPI0024E11B1D|nr:AraC family transcriptional regulator [Paenibacillus glycanilyticus]